MDIHALNNAYAVSAQIDPADLPEIAAAGFKTVICNRPDAEVPPSHQAARIEVAARAAGLEFHVLPLTHQTMTRDVIEQQMQLVSNGTPVLAYCASGTRCTIAWAFGSAMAGENVDDILQSAQDAGYPLHNMRATLAQIAQG